MPPIQIGISKPPGSNLYSTPQALLTNAIQIIFIVAALLVLIMLLWGGIQWILSGGEKEKIATARGRIINALVGLAILALSFVILKVIGGVIGFDIFQPFTLPTPS